MAEQTFRINIIVNPRGAIAGAAATSKALKRTGRVATDLRGLLLRTFGVLALAAGIGASIRLLSDFEQAIATVAAVSSATEQQLASLRSEVERLGITTRFTATDAAEGLVLLARAGFSANEALRTIGGTLLLAQAGALSIAQATDIAASSLRGFRLAVSQTERVVDVLALAANSANTTVSLLGEAIKFVAPVAAGLSLTIEETTAALAALSDAGLKGTLAGTGLRRVLAELESPSQRTIELFGKLGVRTEEVKVSQVGLTDALFKLKRAGIDTGIALEVFGQRGGPAFEVLSNSIPRILELTDNLNRAGGTARRVATIMDRNLKGALLAVRSALQGIIIAAGGAGVSGVLTTLFGVLAEGLRAVAANIQIFIAAVSALTAVLIALAIKGIAALIIKLKALNIAIFTNPFFILAAGIAVASLALFRVRKRLDEFTGALKDAETTSLTAFGQVGERILLTQKRIEQLEKRLRSTRPSGALLIELDRLKRELEDLKKLQDKFASSTRKASEEEAAQKRATAILNASFEKAIKNLKDEARLLKLGNKEREVQSRLLEKINELQEEGARLTPTQEQAIEDRIRANQSLSDQSQLLDQLRGPQEDFNRRLNAAVISLDNNRISADEFRQAIINLKREFPDFKLPDLSFPEIGIPSLTALKAPTADLGISAVERLSKQLALQARLRGLGNDERRIEIDLQRIIEEQRKREEPLDKAGIERTKDRLQLLQQLSAQAQVLNQISGQREGIEARRTAALQLLKDENITAKEFIETIRTLDVEAASLGTTIEDGLVVGFARVQDTLFDLSGLAENTLVNAFQSAEDALTSFLTTGEVNFSEFVDGILADVARLLSRQALGGLLSLAGGGLPGGGGGGILGFLGFRHGGSPPPNTPVIVGENGPELFTTPSAPGTIISNDQIRAAIGGETRIIQAPAPNVNITVNVDRDGNVTVAQSIESGEADPAIIGAITRNRRQVRRSIS